MNFELFAVEIFTGLLIAILLIADFFLKNKKRALWIFYLAGTALILGFAVFWRAEGTLFQGAYTADGLSWFSKIVILAGTLFIGALSIDTIKVKQKYIGAYCSLLLSASLGMMFLVSSKELITLYVGLETSAISLYGLTALYKKDELSLEAGVKYVMLGALSSGILLFGLSLVYGATGTTYLDIIKTGNVAAGLMPVFTIGCVLTLIGVCFKLSVVPMHLWVPDVYQGAPTPVTAFISVVSKTAGFVFALRLFSLGFVPAQGILYIMILVIAAITMTVGNLTAIPQKNMKRLLAYSTISQAGYILVGFAGSSVTGMSSVLFYLLVYMFTNIAAFTVVIAFSHITGSDEISDYAGLARKSPLLALAFLLALLSLAGIPPLAGFVGKFYIFYSAMQQGYLWLVIVAALNSIVSLFYYLLILKQMYIFDRTREFARIVLPLSVRIVLIVTIAGILGLGIFPTQFMNIIDAISRSVVAGGSG